MKNISLGEIKSAVVGTAMAEKRYVSSDELKMLIKGMLWLAAYSSEDFEKDFRDVYDYCNTAIVKNYKSRGVYGF